MIFLVLNSSVLLCKMATGVNNVKRENCSQRTRIDSNDGCLTMARGETENTDRREDDKDAGEMKRQEKVVKCSKDCLRETYINLGDGTVVKENESHGNIGDQKPRNTGKRTTVQRQRQRQPETKKRKTYFEYMEVEGASREELGGKTNTNDESKKRKRNEDRQRYKEDAKKVKTRRKTHIEEKVETKSYEESKPLTSCNDIVDSLMQGQEPFGFDRGLEAQRILGYKKINNEIMLFIEWKGCDAVDVVAASEVNERVPQMVIEFYEAQIKWREPTEHDYKLVAEQLEM